MPKYNALTVKSEGLLRVLKTKCGISKAISIKELNQGVPHPKIKEFIAVWDTGASSSAISSSVPCNLPILYQAPWQRARDGQDPPNCRS